MGSHNSPVMNEILRSNASKKSTLTILTPLIETPDPPFMTPRKNGLKTGGNLTWHPMKNPKDSQGQVKLPPPRWFKVTFSSPSWRSLNHFKQNCQVFGAVFETEKGSIFAWGVSSFFLGGPKCTNLNCPKLGHLQMVSFGSHFFCGPRVN